MAKSLQDKSADCDLGQVLRYLDQDMPMDSLLEFEAHLANCDSCNVLLNQEKQILLAVREAELVQDVPALPDDFARRVSVAAVNDIGTIRQPDEKFVAISICALLGLFALAALGGSLNGLVGTLDGALALMSIVGNLLYRIAFGLTALVRPFSNYLGGNNLGLFTGLVVVLGLAVFYFHRAIISSRS